MLAGTMSGMTDKRRPNVNLGYPGSDNFACLLFINFLISVNYDFSGAGVSYFTGSQSADYSLSQ
jgi:hypothetical protein